MSQYIDAIVIPVPRANLDTYKRMSEEWGNAHLRHGALYYSDSISDDVHPGKITSFPQAVQLKDGTILVLETYVTPGESPGQGRGLLYVSDDDYRTLQGPLDVTFNLPGANFHGSTGGRSWVMKICVA